MRVIIFGLQQMAELAHYYLTNDSDYEVSAFCVNQEFKNCEIFHGLPVVSFEEIENKFPPSSFYFFAPLYANKMNMIRRDIYHRIKFKGYKFISYISSKAYTWNSKIGENCFIFEGCNIQPYVKIGDDNIIWSFTHIGHHSVLGDHNFISGHVVVAGNNKIGDNCFLGTNSSTRENLSIADGTLLGQGASLISDTTNHSVYLGVPAKKKEGLSSVGLI